MRVEYLWREDTGLPGDDAIVLPSGFSYDDYLRCGANARFSPIMHLDDVQAPLPPLGGELGPRCPPRQIREVAERLRARGEACDFEVHADEGHKISGVENRVDYDRRTVEFILRHTRGGG